MALKRTVLAVWLPEPLTVATWIERSLTTFSFSGTGCVSVTSTWVIPIRLLWSSPLPQGRSRRSCLLGPELALKRARKLLRGPAPAGAPKSAGHGEKTTPHLSPESLVPIALPSRPEGECHLLCSSHSRPDE